MSHTIFHKSDFNLSCILIFHSPSSSFLVVYSGHYLFHVLSPLYTDLTETSLTVPAPLLAYPHQSPSSIGNFIFNMALAVSGSNKARTFSTSHLLSLITNLVYFSSYLILLFRSWFRTWYSGSHGSSHTDILLPWPTL